uniref:Uncharacterized protein n=1 Tax=Agrobacterium albertimagni TaxID=147266 RepID=A0A7C1NVR1_9HYPH
MPDFAHIATSLATDPLAGLLLAIPLSIALVIPAQKLWWIHALIAAFLLILSLAFHDKRHLSFDSYLVGLFAFAAVSRDISHQPLLYHIGIFWFASFALISAVIYAPGERIGHKTPLERPFSEPAVSAALIKRDT